MSDRRPTKTRDFGFVPRGMRREAAAFYLGFSPTKFDELIKDGRVYRGKMVNGCRVWDRHRLDHEFEAMMDDGDAEAAGASIWDKVA